MCNNNNRIVIGHYRTFNIITSIKNVKWDFDYYYDYYYDLVFCFCLLKLIPNDGDWIQACVDNSSLKDVWSGPFMDQSLRRMGAYWWHRYLAFCVVNNTNLNYILSHGNLSPDICCMQRDGCDLGIGLRRSVKKKHAFFRSVYIEFSSVRIIVCFLQHACFLPLFKGALQLRIL